MADSAMKRAEQGVLFRLPTRSAAPAGLIQPRNPDFHFLDFRQCEMRLSLKLLQ